VAAIALLTAGVGAAGKDGITSPTVGNRIPDNDWTPHDRLIQLDSAGLTAPLKSVLEALRAEPALSFHITPNLYGRTVKVPTNGPVAKFFHELITTNENLAFFFELGTKDVWIYDPARDGQQQVVVPLARESARSFLLAVGASVACSGHPDFLVYDPSKAGIVVKKPQKIIDFAKRFSLELLSTSLREPMVFELRYASATTQNVEIGGAAIEALGVKERLTKIFEFGADLSNFDRPAILTDDRLNNIIIVDHPDRKEIYQKVIDQFDRPRELVEITAAIIDIEVTNGFDWQSQFEIVGQERPDSAEHYIAGFGTTASDGDFTTTNTPLPPEGLAAGTGLNAATMLIGSNYRILSKVKALEKEGKARLLSQPSVLTIDNSPAQIINGTTAYNTVVGDRQAKFYAINAGLELNILPRIVETPKPGAAPIEPRQLHLLVNIGDGSVAPSAAAGVTLASDDNRIITQTILRDGESMLIGGRYENTQMGGTEHVPIIGKIPLLGLPFKKKNVADGTFQRLYLITARIVKPGDSQQQERHDAAAEAIRQKAERDAADGAEAQSSRLAAEVYTLKQTPPTAEAEAAVLQDRVGRERRTPIRDFLRHRDR